MPKSFSAPQIARPKNDKHWPRFIFMRAPKSVVFLLHLFVYPNSTLLHTYMHTYIHTYIHTCMHTYIHTLRLARRLRGPRRRRRRHPLLWSCIYHPLRNHAEKYRWKSNSPKSIFNTVLRSRAGNHSRTLYKPDAIPNKNRGKSIYTYLFCAWLCNAW